MQIKRLEIACLILILLTSSVLTISVSSEENPLPFWNEHWSYRQEIKIPISTDGSYAKFQPIDIGVKFDKNCWTKNENERSIRVCCWDGSMWHELESQIYNLNFTDDSHISSCRLIFLIPELADGSERYFVYYDDNEKQSPNYIDHVDIEDEYYYYEPISGISVEGDYYKITDDDCIVYAVGQKGQVIDRKLSQCIIKMKSDAKKFDITSFELLASFAFSYQHGSEDKDEISSDQVLVSKEKIIDGNLMVECGIVSESSNKEIRTTNIYRYYHCPANAKRINVNVHHEVLQEGFVKDMVNADGRFGALISLRSRSTVIKKMCFGQILPYLHVYGEKNKIEEYKLDENPQGKKREWIISYLDNCDVGKDGWISYDDGDSGKCHAVLFSSNKVVKQGTDERDGIQVKVAEKEYLDVVGTEVDYASITFGRNSYEPGSSHDLDIPGDLIVEFNAEFFSMDNGSYEVVSNEGKFFRTLDTSRYEGGGGTFEGNQDIYTLTVIPHMSGRVISYPYLVNKTGLALPVTWVELYQNDTLISSGIARKPFTGLQVMKFPKLPPGEYIVKIYRKTGNHTKNYIGVGSVKINNEDMALHVYCTWQKSIRLNAHDQHSKNIKDIELVLSKNNIVVLRNTTGDTGNTTLNVPFNLFDSYTIKAGKDIEGKMRNYPFNLSRPYMLQAFYKGFIIYNKEVSMLQKSVDINMDLYDLTVDVKDKSGMPPGVDVRPFLTSQAMYNQFEIIPDSIGGGKYFFGGLPSAAYDLQISYGSFSDKKVIHIPEDGNSTDIGFTANFDLSTELFNSRGEPIQGDNLKIDIVRDEQEIYGSISPSDIVSLPPGKYTINVYSVEKLVGSKNVELTNDRSINIVTTIGSILPILILGIVLAFLGELIILVLFKKISLNTFLKLMAMAVILASLFQPWWVLNASSDEPLAEKNSSMYIIPPTMIDSITYEGKLSLNLATIPEMFTNFLKALLIIVCSGLVLIGASFIPNIVLRRHFSLGLVTASIVFLFIVAAAFSFGMSKICEFSIGSLQGQGVLDILLPSGETAHMASSWGLGIGFYLFAISAVILIAAGVIDFLRRKNWLKLSF